MSLNFEAEKRNIQPKESMHARNDPTYKSIGYSFVLVNGFRKLKLNYYIEC